MRTMKISLLLGALALVAGACSSSEPASAPTPAPASSSAEAPSSPSVSGTPVEMTDDLKFVPAAVSVKVGETVTWKNTGTAPHTVTAKDSAIDKDYDSGNIAGGQSASHEFTTAGTFSYMCMIHPSMTGTVTVS